VDRDDVTSAGVAAIGIVAGTLARAVALGGKVVAAGLGTLGQALRGNAPDEPAPPRRAPSDARSGFAPLSEPAFEPADGVTAPLRPARTVTRRSSAGAASAASSASAAARTAPPPRPAKRATAKSLPPNLRPVAPRETSTPAPVKGAAGAADVVAEQPSAAKKAATKRTTAKKTAPSGAAEPAATPGAATKATAKTAATKKAATKAPAKKATRTKKAAAGAADTPAAGETSVTPD
jgi:DNA-binding protein HU-beta